MEEGVRGISSASIDRRLLAKAALASGASLEAAEVETRIEALAAEMVRLIDHPADRDRLGETALPAQLRSTK